MVYAHSANGEGQRQDLVEHLRNVARDAEAFAAAFGAGQIGRYLGLWHDIGKFDPAWQRYLLESEADPKRRGRGPDHKGAGALLALQHLRPLAVVLQGHHGGLRDMGDCRDWLRSRRSDPAVAQALEAARATVPGLPGLDPAGELALPPEVEHDPLAAELFLRMLFSALVDADSLDAEAHESADRAALRGSNTGIQALWERFQTDQEKIMAAPATPVNEVRREVYSHCLARADGPQGIYRLTVPTGGGKTRSAMAFALRHALRHGLRRVVVAVPFLSITDQTAATYRSIFERDADELVLLEHHSLADRSEAADDEEDFSRQALRRRLATENWDAPIIVTTTVQLFESLFERSRRATRKLHRLAASVIIIDEAQTLPAHLLEAILDVLQRLCTEYRTTVVLSTATQPAFEAIPAFAAVPNEIVPEPARLFDRLRRVEYSWPGEQTLSWEEAAAILRGESQALAVLNTKANALSLLDALGDPEAFHLSTLLCGAHRRRVLEDVRRRLAAGRRCRVVATQVVEAGVDVDFPLVLRALGPLDSIIQAAGRCNREGRLERGRVVVFQPAEGGLPRGTYATATDVARTLAAEARLKGGRLDPDFPETARRYFRQLFEVVALDRDGIQECRSRFDYPEVARRFRMIDEPTESVVITSYGAPEERARVRAWLDALRDGRGNPRLLLRRLQPYLVSLYSHEAAKYRDLISDVALGIGEWMGAYDEVRGLAGADPHPDALVC